MWDLPLVEDGVVFLAWKKKLIAQEERTQRKVWTHTCDGSPRALWQGKVIAWAKQDEGTLFDSRTGQVHGTFQGLAPLEVALVGDALLVTTVDDGPFMYAMDLRRNVRLWEVRPGSRDNQISSVFAASPEAVFFGLQDGTVRAIDQRNGHETWRRSVADLTWTHPTDGVLNGAVTGTAVVHGDLVIFRVDANHVVAFGIHDGRPAWTFKAPARTTDGCLFGSRYYVTDWANNCHILDGTTGRVLFKADLRSSLPSRLAGISNHFPVLISETHLFTGSADGSLLAFERDSGKFVWSHRPKGGGSFQAQSYFMSANGRFYYADMSGRLYCLEETNPSGSGKASLVRRA